MFVFGLTFFLTFKVSGRAVGGLLLQYSYHRPETLERPSIGWTQRRKGHHDRPPSRVSVENAVHGHHSLLRSLNFRGDEAVCRWVALLPLFEEPAVGGALRSQHVRDGSADLG